MMPAGCGEHSEQRKLLFFTLNYFWMNTEAFMNSKEHISLLRTHEVLPENHYFFKITYKTFLIDLSRSLETIFSGFDRKSAKDKINKALRKGVTVKAAETREEKKQFHEFYQAFTQQPKRRNKILVLKEHELDNLIVLYAVSAAGEYLGGICLLPSSDGRYLLAKYSATLHKFCESELLQWHGMQYAKEAGYSYFDLSWMLLTEDKDSDQYRLFQFKRKFGGEMVDFYSYVKIKGLLKVPGRIFNLILKGFFKNDINEFALYLKRMKVFA